jgi:hypothetical protein
MNFQNEVSHGRPCYFFHGPAVYSRTQRHPPAATDASIKYQQLLRVTRVTIPTLDERNVDACLLTIFLMSRYEDIMHRSSSSLNSKAPFAMSLQSLSHHNGAMAILKIWKNRLSHSHPATDIIKQTRRGLIKVRSSKESRLAGMDAGGKSFR